MSSAVSYKLTNDKFLLFGDSITEYSFNSYPIYPNGPAQTPEFTLGGALVNAYVRRLEIAPRGFGGYNSEQGRVLYSKILEAEEAGGSKVVLSTIYFGTNDAALGNSPQKAELGRYEENIRYLIKIAQEKGIKVILIGPGLHDAERWNVRLSKEEISGGRFRTNENNKIYSDKLKQIAQDTKVPFVSMYDRLKNYEGDWRELLSDGIHYTGKGYKLLFEGILEAVNSHYPELAPEQLPLVLPHWRSLPSAKEFISNIEEAN